MNSGCVWTDTSYFQDTLSMNYERHWVGFRGCDGTFTDPKFRANLAVAKRLHDNNRILGATIYLVYRPGLVEASVDLVKGVIKEVLGALPRWVTFEVDAESWGGQIKGNRSGDLNRMASLLAVYADNDLRRVLAYGNRYDLGNMWSTRIKGLQVNVASYGTQLVTYPNMISQQYGDGTSNNWGHPFGLPLESKDFGHCDHNIFVGLSAGQVAARMGVLGPGTTVVPTGDEFQMAEGLSAASKKDVEDLIDARLNFFLPRLVATLRRGLTNRAFPAKARDGAPAKYPLVIDGRGVDGMVREAAGSGYFFASADGKTGKPSGHVFMLVGDKKYRVKSPAELLAMNPAKTVHALDPGHLYFTLPTL